MDLLSDIAVRRVNSIRKPEQLGFASILMYRRASPPGVSYDANAFSLSTCHMAMTWNSSRLVSSCLVLSDVTGPSACSSQVGVTVLAVIVPRLRTVFLV